MNSITINFQNANLTTTTSQIIVTNGNFAIEASEALSMTGTINFSSIYITSGAVNFNVESGTSFNATVVVPVSASGGAPTIEVTNFAGSVVVTWPTSDGLQTQTLMAGDPITLDGFAN